ncbi:hypothetical protein GCM10023068_28270 [Leifsonia shinshuensis]
MEDQSSDAGRDRNRLATARVTVARCSSPLAGGTISPRREAMCRRAFAVIGVQLCTLGFDKVVVSSAWLGLQLGLTEDAARLVIRSLVNDLRWLSPAGRRGRAGRYRFRTLETEDLRQRAWLHSDTVNELGAGTADTALAQVLMAAGHPALSYGELTTQLWIAWLHQAAGVPDDSTLGVSIKPRRSQLRRSPVTGGGLDLLDQLDEQAARDSAFAARDAAEAAFRQRAVETAARLAAHRAASAERYRLVKAARAAVRAVIDTTGLPPADREDARRWMGSLTAAVREHPWTEQLAAELRTTLTKRGWSEAMVDAAIQHLERVVGSAAA